MQIAAGSVQCVLLRLSDAGAHQWTAIAADEQLQRTTCVLAGELPVLITAPDQFAAEQPQVVAMPTDGRLAQAFVEQV